MPLPSSVDWTKALTFAVGIATILFGVTAALIQWRQMKIQQQQAETNAAALRLALFEKRMVVFDATLNFIRTAIQNTTVELPELVDLMGKTARHKFLFGPEIGNYIEQAHKRGTALR